MSPEIIPPLGATNYEGGEEAIGVEAKPQKLERGTRKQAPGVRVSSNLEPRDWYQLSFSSETFIPEPGLDNRLLKATEDSPLMLEEKRNTYSFLLLNEDFSEETEEELKSLGVQILGPHDTALKVKLPLERNTLEAVADLPYVEWLGYSLPEQKLSQELQDAVTKFGDEVNQFPILINLFEGDHEGLLAERLKKVGVSLGQFDSDLQAYTAVATKEAIKALSDLDFVLFVELDQPTGTGHDQSMATMGVDYIRLGGSGTNFSGSSTILGILDTGFMLGGAAPTMHNDLNKNGSDAKMSHRPEVSESDWGSGIWEKLTCSIEISLAPF